MTKKKLMMAGLSAGLVAVVGIGGTLAYLSDKSEVVTNTFTVGTGYIPGDDENQAVKIDEIDVTKDDGSRTDHNDYKDLLPGDELTKDPTVYLTGGSVESYVFVKLDGVDALEGITAKDEDGKEVQAFAVDGWGETYWTKVREADGSPATRTYGDGIYVANAGKVVDVTEEAEAQYITLGTPLFTTVHFNSTLAELPVENPLPKVHVAACAVQYSEDQMNSWEDAIDSATFNTAE